MANPDLPRAPDLPSWMGRLRDRYLKTDTGQFVLHGNVHDHVLCAGRAWHMTDFLDAFFAPSGKLVVHYDPGKGIWFADDASAAKAALTLAVAGLIEAPKASLRAQNDAANRLLANHLHEELAAERTPEVALHMLETLLAKKEQPVAAIIHYAELVAPDGQPSSLGFLDRTSGARLHRWSLSEALVGNDNIVILVSAAMPDLARRITRNPRVGAIEVPLPAALERAKYLAYVKPGLGAARGETLTRVTAGLQLRQINDLVAPGGPSPTEAATAEDVESVFGNSADPLPLEAIAERKKEILEQECFGLIEVLDPEHGFDAVGGHGPIKAALQKVSAHVRAGRRTQVPMGILFVGPMGTGKSFLAEAFARESGMAAVKLKNFRDKWVGSTEANLEKVLSVIQGLGEILVMIDEGDRSVGGQGSSDGGVSSRVTARLKEFMSDTSHRGRIIFVMMTNRPDKLDTDMKRPGRFDLKIPFFSPQASDDRAAILRAVLRRHKIESELPDEALMPILDGLHGYAAADLEALALLAYDDLKSDVLPDGVETAPETLTAPFLAQAARDFMPTREVAMIEYMELLAVHEASNRRLLPEKFRDIEVAELNARLAAARRALPPVG